MVPMDPGEKAAGVDQAKAEGFSEDALARAFVGEHVGQLRFCHSRGKWLEFDGAIWREDKRRRAFDYARRSIREAGAGAKFGKAAAASGVEQFARADPLLSACADDWDPDPFLLGTPDGAVDLRTGKVLPADHAFMLTRSTSVTPQEGEATLWKEFLMQASGGDRELIRFLQQIAGYSLTADTREHALFFIHGPGGNGKGVFLNTFTQILGDYAVTAAMETFIASRNDRHSTELAVLRGARLVTASETEEGRSWAESRIKQMTGGDPVTARFMRQDNFTFMPAFKLVIIGNHEPVLRNVDEAMRRRFHIVPFNHKPPKVDRTLEARLRAEHPRILRWMIDGCLDWQASGLVRPASVVRQTDRYFEEQDLLGQFLADRCETGADLFDTTASLFAAWEKYAHAAGEYPGKQKAFGSALRKRGFKPDRLANVERTRVYRGVRLMLPMDDLGHAAGTGAGATASHAGSAQSYGDDDMPP
jgi:putative DNA primase/helicase